MFKDYFYQNIQRFNSYYSKLQVFERISSQAWSHWIKPGLITLCILLLQKWPVTNIQGKNKRIEFNNIFPQELPAFSNKWVFTLLASTTSTGYEVHNLIKPCMKKQYKYRSSRPHHRDKKEYTHRKYLILRIQYIYTQKKNLNMIIGNTSIHFQWFPELYHIKETLKRNFT